MAAGHVSLGAGLSPALPPIKLPLPWIPDTASEKKKRGAWLTCSVQDVLKEVPQNRTQRQPPAALWPASGVSSESFDVRRTAVPTADLQRVEQRMIKRTESVAEGELDAAAVGVAGGRR